MPPKKSASTAKQGNLNGFLRKAPGNTEKLDMSDDDAPAASNAKGKDKISPDQSDLPPISDISSMFEDMIGHIESDLLDLVKHLSGRKLRVATMCSGTESPLLALNLISRALKKKYGVTLEIDHVFSCEIVPWKQAYIERNFQPPVLFRDICELNEDEATTAYGAMAPVPGNVDMLIAGTSCVDYSTLNNSKQDIDAKGESGQTFRGMMGWVKRHQPAIVILENVCGAPWERIKNYFEEAHYSAAYARFDTKQFYIPHTRTRGYLYAVRGDNDKAAPKWKDRVKRLEREASVSYDAFLLPTDDPRIQQGREKLIREENNRGKAHEWAKCETRHSRARLDEQLGNRRPLTNWNENGTCKMLDFAWIDWASSQVDRVWDLLDISFLRKAAEGTDATFKSILWNLSQNVDRQIGSNRQGICPCLTPTMIPYLNFRGGPMIGLEALSLQGLPVDELILTRETEDNLADLAGNAMSSTVVGAVMLSALLLSKHRLKAGPGVKGEPQGEIMEVDDEGSAEGVPDKKIGGDEQLQEEPFDLTTTTDCLSLPELLKLAEESSRLCTCEGRGAITASAITRCQDCNFTSCVRCGGRPEHNYLPIDFAAHPRLSPLTFDKRAKDTLPMCLNISGIDLDYLKSLKSSAPFGSSVPSRDWKPYINALTAAVSQEFRFRDLKRQVTWVATFDSPTAFLEFEMHPTNPEWRLFAKPDPSEPANSHVRVVLSRAVARLRVSKELLEGTWELAFPADAQIDIKVEGVVDEATEGGGLVPAWEARLGLELPQLKNKKVWAKLKLEVEEEDKQWFDVDISGTYTWLPNCAAACGSLHIQEETSQSGAPLFLFLDPTKYAKSDEDPFVFSRTFRRYEYGEERPTVAKFNTAWRQNSKEEATVTCFVDHRWVQAPDASLKTASSREAFFAVPKQELQFTTGKDSCHVAQAVLTAKVQLGEDAPAVWPRNKWVEVDKIHERLTFQSIAFLLERLRNVPNQGRWIEAKHDQEEGHIKCEICAPTPPDIHWERRKGRAAAYEDPVQAGVYERALKDRPSPFITQLNLDKDGFGHVRIGCNIPSLAHRAISRLPYRSEQLVTSYRITTNYIPPAKLVRPKFQLTSNRRDPAHAQPQDFRIPLRPEQLRSLDWMLRQEAADVAEFEEEEIVEAILPPLGWRAEAKASRRVRVRGGVLADEVGYGKTAITLGLISCANRAHPYEEPEEDITKGLIATKASLIVVPPHLTRQWASEVKKFTKKAFVVETISTTTQLNSLSIQAIMNADLIIVASNLFSSTTYLENFEGFAGKGDLPTTYGRYWNGRHKISVQGIREQAKRLQKKGATAVMHKIVEGSKIDTVLRERKGPSKRLRGAQYRAHQEAKEAEAAAGPSASRSPASNSQDRKVMQDVYIDVRLTDLKDTPIPKVEVTGSDDDTMAVDEGAPRRRAAKAKQPVIIISDDESDAPKSKPSAKKGTKSASSTDDEEFKATEEDEESDPASEHSDASHEGDDDDESGEETKKPAPKAAKKTLAPPPKKAVNAKKRKSNAGSDGETEATDDKAEKGKGPAKKKQRVTPPPKKKRFESDPWKLKSSTVKADFAEMNAPPLELFHWHRLVVDEYTYLQDKAHAMITGLEATHRWVLSGTPPIHDFASVKTIAVFLGLHLGVDDDDEAPTRNHKGDKTSVEQFHSFREVRSVDWYRHRYGVGQRFLDQFVRQNIAEIDEIPFEEVPVIIQLPAAERAIERELDHTLRAQEMNTKRNRKTKSDRDRRIAQSLKESKSAEEALLKCVAFYDNVQSGADNAMKACDYVVKVRTEELDECKDDIRTTLELLEKQKAKLGSVEGETHYAEWLRVTKANGVGDTDATAAVLKLYRKALGEDTDDEEPPVKKSDKKSDTKSQKKAPAKGKGKAKKDDDDEISDEKPKAKAAKKTTKVEDAIWEHRETTHQLRLLVKELIGRVRSLRYFNAVRSVQREPGSTQVAFKADCPECGDKDLPDSKLSLLSSCGHMGCHDCVRKAALEEQCVLGPQNCSAPARLLNIVKADSLGTDDGIKDAKRHFGRKLEEVIDIIKKRIPKKERVLLFIQFKDLMKKVAEALTANNVTFLEIQGTATNKSKNLEKFQDPAADEKVLLLGLEDESASGANLTVANHIMFLSPMWPKSKEQYKATETQAIGRARRYGQTKKVNIWRFIAKDTIDVQVYEQFCGINYQTRAEEEDEIVEISNPANTLVASTSASVPRASGSGDSTPAAQLTDQETDKLDSMMHDLEVQSVGAPPSEIMDDDDDDNSGVAKEDPANSSAQPGGTLADNPDAVIDGVPLSLGDHEMADDVPMVGTKVVVVDPVDAALATKNKDSGEDAMMVEGDTSELVIEDLVTSTADDPSDTNDVLMDL